MYALQFTTIIINIMALLCILQRYFVEILDV
jgi:hypothetical protein